MWRMLLLGIALTALSAGPPETTNPGECEDLVRRVLDEIAARHWNPAVRRRAERSKDLARRSCAGRPEVPVAVDRALVWFGDPAIRLLGAARFERMVHEWSGAPRVGVGLTEVLSIDVDETTRRLTVIAPVPGSPAAAAGLRTGDVVTTIDGVPTDSLGLTRSVDRLRRAAGEAARLEVLRTDRVREVVVEATELPELRAVHAENTSIDGVELLVVRLRQFAPGSSDELRAVLHSVSGADAIALDLRGNPGGYVDELVATASLFLEPGSEIARLSGPDPDTLRADDETPRVRLPLVVIVDRGTASVAEALAGALQVHEKARVYGERTYGKGLAHGVRPIEEGVWVLMLPVGRLKTPAGRDVLDHGIEPDVQTVNPLTQAAWDLRRAR